MAICATLIMAGGPLPADAADARVAVLVVGASSLAADVPLRQRLEQAGFTVSVVDDDTVTPAALAPAALVVVSPSADAGAVPPWIGELPVPLVVGDVFVARALGLATTASERNGTSLRLADHAITDDLHSPATVHTTSAPVAAFTPVRGGTVVARHGDGTAAFAAFSTGTRLADGTATRARRVVTHFGPRTPLVSTSTGWSLFRNALTWVGTATPTTTTGSTTTSTTSTTLTSTTTTTGSTTTTTGSTTTTTVPVGIDPAALGMRGEGAFGPMPRFAAYETLLGRPLRWYVAMAGRASIADLTGSVQGQFTRSGAVLPTLAGRIDVIVTVGLNVGDDRAVDDDGIEDIRDGLLDTADGVNDAAYRSVARNLITGGYPDAVIRLGHEFNGTWYPWSAVGNADAYIAAFRHVHDVFRGESPAFRFEWNGAANPTYTGLAADAYPGDDYVDIVGLDVYNRASGTSSLAETVWASRYQSVLDAARDLAVAHGKPIGISEWANTAVDAPAFIDAMASWMASLPRTGPGSLAYQVLFNPPDPSYDLDRQPRSKARYLALFGAP